MSGTEAAETTDSLATARSRRALKDKHGRKAAFEKLRELKGSKHKYEVHDVDSVYDEVGEKEYAKRRQNRMEEDWIVDDDGSGYVEDGREIFDEEEGYEDDIFTSRKRKGGKGISKKISTSKNEKTTGENTLRKMFANMPTKKRKVETQEMSDMEKALLEECLNEVPKPAAVKLPAKYTYERMPPPKPVRELKERILFPQRKELKPFTLLEDRETQKMVNSEPPTQRPHPLYPETDITHDELSGMSFSDLEDMDVDRKANKEEINTISKITEEPAEIENKENIDEKVSVYEPIIVKDMWETTCSLPEASGTFKEVDVDASEIPVISNAEGDKVFHFYWLDAFDDYFAQPGTVYLFGKVFVESAQTHVSCCVLVKNVERRLFLLPRAFRKDSKEGSEEAVTMASVYQEFNTEVAAKYNIKEFKTRKTMKRYCFEKFSVPYEAEYLEVRYSAKYPALPSTLEGDTFCHVFGTNTSFLELLLMERKIKGPCWLDVKTPQPTPKISWCKIETVALQAQFVTPIYGLAAPPLSVMSLSFKTVINPKTHLSEIVLISCLHHKDFCIDKPPPSPLFQTHWCALSKPCDSIWPWDFSSKLSNYKGTKVEKCDTERALLGGFLTKLFKIDPDIIVGHNVFGFDLSILLHRIQTLKIPYWSRIGRLKRTQMPKLTSKGYAERVAVCGRLICDTKISSQELVRAKSYDLGALAKQLIRVGENERPEYSFETVRKSYNTSEEIFQLVNATMQDSFYCLQIMTELNVLPLALQITNIAGNVMSRTLLGGRSERNEFLLMHAFSEKNFICPDKQTAKTKATTITYQKEDESEEGTKANSGKKKASYAGGLVLEPKKGFYDKFILLLDFNSLYPSIIQEYNICFTTVSREPLGNQDDSLPEVPESNLEPGILPTEIRKLVESRREVKKLMKQSDISPELKQQYDIRQKALKLTANSMYGCLGFSNSRFFAKHLAALITGKGREILLNTKNLVQKLNFDVIYGDTDSLMINTHCSDYDQVFKLGHKIKIEVNKLYKHLELDIDGVFKFMLLLKKKKYAAMTITRSPSGQIIAEKELKGLDIVRRDWSQLAADAGNFVLDQILSDQGQDERIENIHAHLENIKKRLDEERVGLDELVITKQLTKNPSDYPDKNSLPHVQVALRMNSKDGKRFCQGDTVPYIICQDGSTLSAVQRAYHLDEVKTNNDLKIDNTYYLAHQVHPVVTRLCDPIEGTNAARIAECLGLDPSGYHSSHSISGDGEEEALMTDVPPEEKYKLCQRFAFRCPSPECQILITLDAPTRGQGSSCELVLESCPNSKCQTKPYKHCDFILNKLRKEIRQHIAVYYQGWLVCEDTSCNYRTRRVPLELVRGYPLCNQCRKGFLCREYSDSQLYKQLCFYEYIFDFQKGCIQNKELRHKGELLKKVYSTLQSEAQAYLKVNSYSVIDLGRIFSYLYTKC